VFGRWRGLAIFVLLWATGSSVLRADPPLLLIDSPFEIDGVFQPTGIYAVDLASGELPMPLESSRNRIDPFAPFVPRFQALARCACVREADNQATRKVLTCGAVGEPKPAEAGFGGSIDRLCRGLAKLGRRVLELRPKTRRGGFWAFTLPFSGVVELKGRRGSAIVRVVAPLSCFFTLGSSGE